MEKIAGCLMLIFVLTVCLIAYVKHEWNVLYMDGTTYTHVGMMTYQSSSSEQIYIPVFRRK